MTAIKAINRNDVDSSKITFFFSKMQKLVLW